MNSSGSRSYSMERRDAATEQRRAAIVRAVKELLAEGRFHDASTDEVARRAGVSRATLYGHFGSRTGLIDAVCETLAGGRERAALRAALELPDPVAAFTATMKAAVAFWAAEETMFAQLTALAAIDTAAADWRERQRADRRAHLEALIERLGDRLAPGVDALAVLVVATSYEAFAELRGAAGASVAEAEATLTRMAGTVLSRGIDADSET